MASHTTRTLPLGSARSHISSSSGSPTRRHGEDLGPSSEALPPSLAWKCLQPMEMPLSRDGELSARNTEHRTPDHFKAVVHDSTWLLNQALQGSGGGNKHSSFGSKTSNGHSDQSSNAQASSTAAATAHSNGHSGSGATAAGGEFFPSSKTRRQIAVQSQRAFALFRLHQFARAIKDYDACLASEPTSAVLYYNRGCAFYAWGKKDRAIQDFTRALKLDCKNILYVESRAVVNKELGRFQEAIQDYTWLETLRRMASASVAGGRHGNATHGQAAKTTARGSDDDGDSSYRTRGSFSMSFSDLQASLLGAAISGSSSRDTLPNGSLVTDGLTTEERETHVLEWMVRFLQHSPRGRKRSDIAEAVQYAKSWSFFRGMDPTMLEQCLEDAVYAYYDADAVVVEQDKRASHFVVVLSPTAPFVKNIDSSSGISKLRELKKLSQGDAVGTDAYTVSFGDGTLRTIKHEIAEAAAVSANPMLKIANKRLRGAHQRHRGSLLALLNSHSLVTMLNTAALSPLLHNVNQNDGSGDHASSLLPPEPASFTSLEPVHCLLLEVEAYRDILHEHEEAVLEERVAFLRGCRVFQSCSADVLTALAAVSGARIYDPGKDLLRTGDEVTHLSVIKRGVCQVRKTIRVLASQARAKPQAKGGGKARSRTAPLSPLGKHGKVSDKDGGDPLSSSRSSGDGSWVLDNGWMLTNPRLVNNAQGNGKEEPMIIQDVDVGILASGQVFGELSVLQPGQSSQVTIHSQTLVEILVFEQSDLAKLHVQYHSGTMNALQESLLFHNPPQQKIVQLQRDLEAWDKEKRGVLRELALHLPGKAQSVIRGASCMSQEPKPPKMLSPMRRRASLVSVPPLSPLTRHKSIKLMRGSESLPGLMR